MLPTSCVLLFPLFIIKIKKTTGITIDLTLSVVQKMYKFSRAALCMGSMSFTVLALLDIFEMEKLQMGQHLLLLLGSNRERLDEMPSKTPSMFKSMIS
uniref:Uncharacterized protein n=1 Tax=Vombatus ursinus TaxID=29139 RepID=A0A4X2KXW1_VOMUR